MRPASKASESAAATTELREESSDGPLSMSAAVWRQWQRGPKRYAELRRRDVGHVLAAQTAGSACGHWRLSNSPALSIALSNAFFNHLGLASLVTQPAA